MQIAQFPCSHSCIQEHEKERLIPRPNLCARIERRDDRANLI